jgi:hypothetical protein
MIARINPQVNVHFYLLETATGGLRARFAVVSCHHPAAVVYLRQPTKFSCGWAGEQALQPKTLPRIRNAFSGAAYFRGGDRMKTKKRLFLFIAAFAMCLLFAGCQDGTSTLDQWLYTLGIDPSSATVVESSDSHGGFHGDGLLFAQISIADDSVGTLLSQRDEWKSLPLSENLTALVYGVATEAGQTGPYLTNDANEPVFPEIQNGYYYFEDRHSKSTDPYDDTDVLERASFNFTLAIYDTDTDTLYYAEFDT